MRLLELLPLRDFVYPISSLRSPPPPSRTLRLLPVLSYVHSTLYRYLFGRPADSLEKSTDNLDEYMIGDDDMVITRAVEVPKEMSELSCGALVAGIVEAVMDGAGFVSSIFRKGATCCKLTLQRAAGTGYLSLGAFGDGATADRSTDQARCGGPGAGRSLAREVERSMVNGVGRSHFAQRRRERLLARTRRGSKAS